MDDATRARVFAQFPNAAPFEDLLLADDEDELTELARLVDGRVRATNQNRTAPSNEPSVEDAIKNRNFGQYLAAKRRRAEQEG